MPVLWQEGGKNARKKESCGSCGNNYSQHAVNVIFTPISNEILSHPLKKFNYCLLRNKAEDRNEQKTIA